MQPEEQPPTPDDDHRAASHSAEWFDGEAVSLIEANDELARARSAIVDLLAEIEDVLLQQNPRIEAEWQVTVGVWEKNLLEAQISVLRTKRKCDLMQSRVNMGDRVDSSAIEEQLDREFEQWREQLEIATAQYQSAVRAQVTAVHITTATADEIKRVFRMIAKRLHPDLHPTLGESARSAFALAQLAYRKGDIKILRSLEVSTRSYEGHDGFCNTLIEAQADLALLEVQIHDLEDRLALIKSQKPYCLRALLNDDEWIADHIAQIKSKIETCNNTEREYCERCDEMTAQNG